LNAHAGEGPPLGIDEAERVRRVQTIVHTALFAGVGIYAVLLLFLRSEIAVVTSARPPGATLFLALAAIGLVQYAVASAVGRAFLRSRRSRPLDRVRLFFLLRGAAAEAIALYGLVLGFLGGSSAQVGALFALAAVALLACAPGRASWKEAIRQAEGV
jgi:F0F1-type ATP synthase membrane subunit c/vacuolar-type H+-ATPase subunit K